MATSAPIRTHTSSRLEAARGIAALSVVSYHVFVVTHGYNGNWTALSVPERLLMFGNFGVYLFFMLSGYLLFRPFLRGGINLKHYALNRALRILPVYYVAVGLLLLIQPGGPSWDQVWHHLTFTEYLDPSVKMVDGPLWSVVCEIQFYTLLPLVACLLVGPKGGRADRALIATVSFFLGAWILGVVSSWVIPYPVWQFSSPANLVLFSAGMLIAATEAHVKASRPKWFLTRKVSLALAVLSLACFCSVLINPSRPWVIAACALALSAVVWFDHFSPTRSRLRPLAALGLVSYSLYVWHKPIVDRLASSGVFDGNVAHNLLAAVPICVAVAIGSYLVIELPFMRLRRKWTFLEPASVSLEMAKLSQVTL